MNLNEAKKQRLLKINKLDELRQATLHHTIIIQHQRAQWNDKFIKKKKFKVGDWALLFDSRFKDFRGKFHIWWIGPYEIDIVYDTGAIKLHTIGNERTPLMENGHGLQLHHKPLSKETFSNRITSTWPANDLEIVNKVGTPTEWFTLPHTHTHPCVKILRDVPGTCSLGTCLGACFVKINLCWRKACLRKKPT